MISLPELIQEIYELYGSTKIAEYNEEEDNIIENLVEYAINNPIHFASDMISLYYALAPDYKYAQDDYEHIAKTLLDYALAYNILAERNDKIAEETIETINDAISSTSIEDVSELMQTVQDHLNTLHTIGEEFANLFVEYIEKIGFSDESYKQVIEYYTRLLLLLSIELLNYELAFALSGAVSSLLDKISDKIDDPDIDEWIYEIQEEIYKTLSGEPILQQQEEEE